MEPTACPACAWGLELYHHRHNDADDGPRDACCTHTCSDTCSDCGADVDAHDMRAVPPACPPRRFTAGAILHQIRAVAPELPATIEQTGGGTATIYLGTLDPVTDRYQLAIGPGAYTYADPAASEFWPEETCIGPDDDGTSPVHYVTSAAELAAYVAGYVAGNLAQTTETARCPFPAA